MIEDTGDPFAEHRKRIGYKLYPIRVSSPDKVFDFHFTEVIPGVTLTYTEDGDLGPYQFIWDTWKSIAGLGMAEKWVVPNFYILVDGEKYIPHLFERTRAHFPDIPFEKDIQQILYKFGHSFFVDRYPVHKHILSSILALKGCRITALNDCFTAYRNPGARMFMSSFGVMLPLHIRCDDILMAPHDEIGTISENSLSRFVQDTEFYYSPLVWSHDRISTALGAYWNFLLAPEYYSAFLSLVTLIEALVSSGPMEISHQVSERTANILAKNAGNKKEIYASVREIYKHRSKLIHGEIKPKKGGIMWQQAYLGANFSSVNINIYKKLIKLSRNLLKFCVADDHYKSIIREKNPKKNENDFSAFMLDIIMN